MANTSARTRIHEAAMQLFAERGTTEINISDLAEIAGVARGTIYNNVKRPEELFSEIATDLAHEMYARVVASMEGVDDPAQRLSNGLRMFMRRAHEEPHWGRFLVRFGMNDTHLRALMQEPPTLDIARGIEAKRYALDTSQLPAAMSIVGGAGLSAMLSVIEGHQTWRDAGSRTAELVLRAFGIPAKEARAISTTPLAPLADESAPRVVPISSAKAKPKKKT